MCEHYRMALNVGRKYRELASWKMKNVSNKNVWNKMSAVASLMPKQCLGWFIMVLTTDDVPMLQFFKRCDPAFLSYEKTDICYQWESLDVYVGHVLYAVPKYLLNYGYMSDASFLVNSLWPGDAMWWHKLGSTINIGWCVGLLPDGTKPLPQPLFTDHQESRVAFTNSTESVKYLSVLSLSRHFIKNMLFVSWNLISV